MTTYTSNIAIPYLDSNVASPEVPENEDKTITDAAIGGVLTITAGTHTLDDTAITYPQEIHNAVLHITIASGTITVPSSTQGTTFKKQYIIINASGGIVTITCGIGTNQTIADGTTGLVFCDGTDVWRIS